MKFTIAKCVWGPDYVATMLDYNLPSLLAPGNLPRVAARHRIEHVLYTTAADAALIRRSAAFQALAALVPSTLIEIDAGEQLDGAGYGAVIDRMNTLHNRILQRCREEGRIWLFDQPDHVWADGSLGNLADLAATGHDCIVFPAVRTVKEQVCPILDRLRGADGVIAPDNRTLVGIALDNLHTHDCVRSWGPDTATIWPHHISWRVAPGAMLRRAFYTQPFALRPPASPVSAERSLDMHYLDRAFPDLSSVHFIADTDEFFVLEVSTQFHVHDANPQPLSLGSVSAWAAQSTGAYQRACFHRPVRFHRNTVSGRRWRRMEDFSGQIAAAVDDCVALREVAASFQSRRPLLALLIRRLLGLIDRRPLLPWRVPSLIVVVPPEEALAPAALLTPDADLWRMVADHAVAGRHDPEMWHRTDRAPVTLSGLPLPVVSDGSHIRINQRTVTDTVRVSDRLWLLLLGPENREEEE